MQTHTVVKGYIEWLYDNMFSARALKKKTAFHYVNISLFFYLCMYYIRMYHKLSPSLRSSIQNHF